MRSEAAADATHCGTTLVVRDSLPMLRSLVCTRPPLLRLRTMTDFQAKSALHTAAPTAESNTVAASAGPSTSQTKVTSHNQYHTSGLDQTDLLPNPLALFQKWFEGAQSDGVKEPEAMLISTCDTSSDPPRPSSRVVLLKSIHPTEGLTFYSNYLSRKGREISANTNVSAVFYWRETHRSVRFLGKARKVDASESQEYFDSRPVGSRIGAWSSPQSTVVNSRQELEDKVRETENRFNAPGAAGLEGDAEYKGGDVKIPVPDFWGGYRIEPYEVEFWCGRPNRLHDRFCYTRPYGSAELAGLDKWQVNRLAP